MSTCRSCGNPVPEGAQVCTKCGASLAQPVAQPVQGKSKGCGKIAFVVLIILLLFIGGIGGVGYWGYLKIRQKVEQKLQQVKSGLGSETKNKASSRAPEFPEVSCPPSDLTKLSLDRGIIPMKVGLTMAKIWTMNNGDSETLTQVQSIDNSAVTVTASGPDRNSKDPSAKVHGRRKICISDLSDGDVYVTSWGADFPETVRGSTMFSLPRNQFEALKTNHPVSFTYEEELRLTGNGKYRIGRKLSGTISRLEPQDVPFGIIVNDQKLELPTIHAKGTLDGSTTELNVVDDVNSPIVLDFGLPQRAFRIKILKISYPEEKKIEQQLADFGKVQVYGIYFDFNSANIRDESEPVLKEIADALQAHPDWKLTVNGHTDSIGGASYNMALSNRRAAAVKQALVDRYNIQPDRLSTAGFGMTQPIESNDTPEGRARNRRVELIKQ